MAKPALGPIVGTAGQAVGLARGKQGGRLGPSARFAIEGLRAGAESDPREEFRFAREQAQIDAERAIRLGVGGIEARAAGEAGGGLANLPDTGRASAIRGAAGDVGRSLARFEAEGLSQAESITFQRMQDLLAGITGARQATPQLPFGGFVSSLADLLRSFQTQGGTTGGGEGGAAGSREMQLLLRNKLSGDQSTLGGEVRAG